MSNVIVINRKKLKKLLPTKIYDKYLECINHNAIFDNNDLLIITDAIKELAIQNNVKKYAHVFFPLTNRLSYKYTSLYKIENEEIKLSFDVQDLIRNEIDSSSIISSKKLIDTKGYLYWDYYSYLYIIDDTLYIPCFFINSNNTSLDIKYPLRKSTEYISSVCKRMCHILLENNVETITPLSGLEIEYYLLSKQEKDNISYPNELNMYFFENKKDKYRSPHYLHSISQEIRSFMNEINDVLLKMNIVAKVEHKEVSLNQYELVLFYNDCNLTFEYNYIILTLLNDIASKHQLLCILSEKPFTYRNGSGKHNNYSLITNTKINLFNKENFNLYLITISSLLRAINTYSPLISLSVFSPSNNYRLGKNEAPSNIISVSLSDEIISYFEKGIEPKTHSVPFALYNKQTLIKEENVKRNRTSPIGILNNKVEFRLLGSSMSEGLLNTIINTILGVSIELTLDEIIKEMNKTSLNEAIRKVTTQLYNENKKIIYNESCYSNEYITYAKENNLLIFDKINDLLSYIEKNKTYSPLIEKGVFTIEEITILINHIKESTKQYYEEEIYIIYETLNNIIIPKVNKSILSYSSINKTKYTEERIESLYSFINNVNDNLQKLESIINNNHIEEDYLNQINIIKNELLNEYHKIEYFLLEE